MITIRLNNNDKLPVSLKPIFHTSHPIFIECENHFSTKISLKLCQNRRRRIRKIPPSIIFLLHFGQIFRPYLSRSMRSLSGEMVVVFSKNVDNFTAVAVLSEFTDCWLQKMNKWLIMHLMVMGTGWTEPPCLCTYTRMLNLSGSLSS